MTSDTTESLPGLAALNLNDNDFVLFGLAPRFAQDRAAIDARWKALQARVHPDRFAAANDEARHLALQWATRINEAYQHLKDPLARAICLCKIRGHDVHAEPQPAMPAAFLMQQMALREALEEANTLEAIEAVAAVVSAQRQALLQKLEVLIDDQGDWPVAAAQLRALMFINRVTQDVDRRLDAKE